MKTLAQLGALLIITGCSQLSWVAIGAHFEHESNGSKIFGSPPPNPGFEAAGLSIEAGIPLYDGSNTTVSGGVSYLEPARVWAHDTMHTFKLNLRFEREACRWEALALDLGAGSLTYVPIDGKTPGVGGDVMFRLRYLLSEWVEPFVQAGAGVMWFPKRWEPQGTSWGFPLFAAFGFVFHF